MRWLLAWLFPQPSFYCNCGQKVSLFSVDIHGHHKIGSVVYSAVSTRRETDPTLTKPVRLRTFCDGTDHL